jgi:hypothetical protein
MGKGTVPATSVNDFNLADQANLWLAITGGVPPTPVTPSTIGQRSLFTLSGTLSDPQTAVFDLTAILNTFTAGVKLRISVTAVRLATIIANPAPPQNLQNVSCQIPGFSNPFLVAIMNAVNPGNLNFINMNPNIKLIQNVTQGSATSYNIPMSISEFLTTGQAAGQSLTFRLANAAQGEFVPDAFPQPADREIQLLIEAIN